MSQLANIKNVVIYTRVSTSEQAESGLGLAGQLAACEKLAKEKGWKIEAPTFTDAGVTSDLAATDRPELARAVRVVAAMNAIAKKEGREPDTAILAAKQDRLERDGGDLAWLKKNTIFLAADDPEANNLMRGFKSLINEEEKARIKARTKAALGALRADATNPDSPNHKEAAEKVERIKAGLAAGRTKERTAHATATRTTKASVFALEQRPRIAEVVMDGATSLMQIATALNANGYVTPRGTAWTPAAVKRVLDNLAAMGKEVKIQK